MTSEHFIFVKLIENAFVVLYTCQSVEHTYIAIRYQQTSHFYNFSIFRLFTFHFHAVIKKKENNRNCGVDALW